MKNDVLGNRMKMFEGIESDRRLMPGLPVLARLDGRSFHNFCKGLRRPFDERFRRLMTDVTRYLVMETNANIGYTQSDEITLLWEAATNKSQIFFDGRIAKMTSVLAAMASVYFNKILPQYLPRKAGANALFDCRVWSVPNRPEAVNVFLWREADAVRNSIQSVGQFYFSHNELNRKSCNNIQEMLFQQKNVNWNDFPDWAKRGTYVQRQKAWVKFTAREIEKLPNKHNARKHPDMLIERSLVAKLDNVPPLSKIYNAVGFIFDGEFPTQFSKEAQSEKE